MRDWSELPDQAIELISTLLPNPADYLCFRAVCNSFRTPTPNKPQPPWLVVDYLDQHRNHSHSLALYTSPTSSLPIPPRLPTNVSYDRYICGSCRGWIALIDDSPSLTLHNPLTGARIPLPVITSFPESNLGNTFKKTDQGFGWYHGDRIIGRGPEPFHVFQAYVADKLVFSCDPGRGHGDAVAVALCCEGQFLIRCRVGPGSSWAHLWPYFPPRFFTDIVFYKGMFYAVSSYTVFVCDVGGDGLIDEVLPADPLFSDGKESRVYMLQKSYLVVSSGDLLLASLRLESRHTDEFEVFRVDLMDGGKQMKLVKMDDLGGRALFLGMDSMSVSSAAGGWCKGNCIYYAHTDCDTKPGTGTFIKEYNLEDGTSTVITTASDNRWGAHWLTPSLF